MDKNLSVAAGTPATRSSSAKTSQPASPTRSDRSSDSEGRPVREKLKETRIDAPGTADQLMHDAKANGRPGEASVSGSDNERGRLRRKRSREDMEDDAEDAKPQGKKHERHHARKRSRDVTSPIGSDMEASMKKANGSVAPIAEKDESTSGRQITPEATASDKEGGAVTSPQNKRKLEHTAASSDTAAGSFGAPAKADERDTKRPRDAPVTKVTESKTTIPAGSGFANTSAASPFASIGSKSPVKSTEAPTADLPQTSDQAFKSSGFGAFASSAASPFAAAGKSGTSSPFGAAGGAKLSSFAAKPATTTPSAGGFAGLGGTMSSFASASSAGKSTFGGALGASAFGNIIGGKPGLSTFGGGGSITGLKQKAAPEFGAAATNALSDDEGDDSDGKEGEDGDTESERRTSQPLLSSTERPETGEENEDAQWVGRAKLYTFASHDDGEKSWQERGVGPLKLNVTREEPFKARFVLRADGTHRLLLNVAITSTMTIGDASGGEPTSGRVLFTAPTATGEIESHMLRLKSERAVDLWNAVNAVKKEGKYV